MGKVASKNVFSLLLIGVMQRHENILEPGMMRLSYRELICKCAVVSYPVSSSMKHTVTIAGAG